MPHTENTTWKCLACAGKPEFSCTKAFLIHAKTVHGLKDGAVAEAIAVQFLDGTDWYENTYEVKITVDGKELEFIKTVSGKRTGKDRWGA